MSPKWHTVISFLILKKLAENVELDPFGTKRTSLVSIPYLSGLLEIAYKWGARSKVEGAKRRNFKQNPLFLRNFGEILAKVGGQLTPLPPWFQQP